MDINLTAHHMATELSRTRLPAKAERGWLVEQAIATHAERSGTAGVRRWIGAALIHAGERMQGLPRPTVTAIADQSHAPVRAS